MIEHGNKAKMPFPFDNTGYIDIHTACIQITSFCFVFCISTHVSKHHINTLLLCTQTHATSYCLIRGTGKSYFVASKHREG